MSNAEKVLTNDLEIGMHVTGLDRPWLETPFVLQGFVIKTNQDIDRLRQYCRYVYVQKALEKGTIEYKPSNSHNRPRQSRQQLFVDRKLTDYVDDANWQEEYPRAKQAVAELSDGIDSIFDNVTRGGALEIVKIKQAVQPMIDSITRNPDACIWLARMKQEDNYTYQHSLGASIWAVALGRQLGLPKQDLRSLAIGGLLFDVGKLKVPRELLSAERELSPDEFELVKKHVDLGLESVKESGVMNQDVIDMVAHHHERHDGSGYPNGLKADDIPVFARIAAIVDCYDAITSHRSYARAIPPSLAIKKLYERKDIDYQAELVEEFIQAIGIYPAGTLVELSSGEVAVVVAEYRSRRLRPRVLVLLDNNKAPLKEMKMIDLLTETESDEGERLEIISSLEPEAYGIDMAGIQL